ncbi:23373_t:CDS:10 [Cetraspora pellucida]|uniref:23373_t:CDS:1 n=1 Tax=Cetraspora pellucida TaxID=1433469 RepID=A0A9N9BWZ1_9GLOM|nr:23373_t:CDS:10 [Cetraspora pellucida]
MNKLHKSDIDIKEFSNTPQAEISSNAFTDILVFDIPKIVISPKPEKKITELLTTNHIKKSKEKQSFDVPYHISLTPITNTSQDFFDSMSNESSVALLSKSIDIFMTPEIEHIEPLDIKSKSSEISSNLPMNNAINNEPKTTIELDEDPDKFVTITEKDKLDSIVFHNRMQTDVRMCDYAKEAEEDPKEYIDITDQNFDILEKVLNLSTGHWIKKNGKLFQKLLCKGYKYTKDLSHYLNDVSLIDLDEYGTIYPLADFFYSALIPSLSTLAKMRDMCKRYSISVDEELRRIQNINTIKIPNMQDLADVIMMLSIRPTEVVTFHIIYYKLSESNPPECQKIKKIKDKHASRVYNNQNPTSQYLKFLSRVAIRHKIDHHNSEIHYTKSNTSDSDLDADPEPKPEALASTFKTINKNTSKIENIYDLYEIKALIDITSKSNTISKYSYNKLEEDYELEDGTEVIDFQICKNPSFDLSSETSVLAEILSDDFGLESPDKSDKRQKSTTKEDESSTVKKLIKVLKDDKIVKTEANNDIASQKLLNCCFHFGKKLSDHLNYYKNEKKYQDHKAQSKVDKEVKDQLPKEVNDTTRWKQTERAKKI